MKAVHCIVSPHLDAPHFSEWVEHHLNFGFDKIFVFNMGKPMYDIIPAWKTIKGKVILSNIKRFSPPFSDNELIDIWRAAINKHKNHVEETVVETSGGRLEYYKTQKKLISENLKRYENMGVKWVANIDADELICGELNLDEVEPTVGRIRITSYIYENVRECGSFRAGRESGKLTDAPLFECYKNVVRPCAVKEWIDVHYEIKLYEGYKMITGKENLYFEHYCGRKHKQCPIVYD